MHGAIFSAGNAAHGLLLHDGSGIAECKLKPEGVVCIDSTSSAVFVVYSDGRLTKHQDGQSADLQGKVRGPVQSVKCAEDKAFILTKASSVFMYAQDKLEPLRFPHPVAQIAVTKDSIWGLSPGGDLMGMVEGSYSGPKIVMNQGADVVSIAAFQIEEEFICAVVMKTGWRLVYACPRFLRVLPKREEDPPVFATIVGRESLLVGITPDGSAYAFGTNDAGQLGDGTTESRFVFGKVKFGTNAKIESAACGNRFALFRTVTGVVFGCGLGEHGQLMTGASANETLPKQISLHQKITEIWAGHQQSFVRVAGS